MIKIRMLQASLEHMIEAHHALAEGFLNRLFALLNWTLTEFTISSQVRSLDALSQPCASQVHAYHARTPRAAVSSACMLGFVALCFA